MTLEDDTKEAVIARWHEWRARELGVGHQATAADVIRFCAELARKRSDLLNRCPPGDPWQHIKDWLIGAGARRAAAGADKAVVALFTR
jgi:hypothetical protein